MSGIAIISVDNEKGLVKMAAFLASRGVTLAASKETASTLRDAGLTSVDISILTGSLEMLGGQVMDVYSDARPGNSGDGIGSIPMKSNTLSFSETKYVIVNLKPISYPVNNQERVLAKKIDDINLKGVTMLRAGAKNHKRVTVLCDTDDYDRVIEEITASKEHNTKLATRQQLALKAFNFTSTYDDTVADYMRREYSAGRSQLSLGHGLNPHQIPAQLFTMLDKLPIQILNGCPDYVNLCNALNGFELVNEINVALDIPAAASFKHLSPAGVGIGLPLSEDTAKVCMVQDIMSWMTPLAYAVARARGADRMSSFGDLIALSDKCDVATARVILREASDGIIAPGYSTEALEILSSNQGGAYCVLQMDKTYAPRLTERRTVYGLTLEQKRSFRPITMGSFHKLVSFSQEMPLVAMQDLVVATCTAKFTQSNAVVLAKDGQTIGIGAGQQSRLKCTRLAAEKADHWWLLHHPEILNQHKQEDLLRSELAYKINQLVLMTDEQLRADFNMVLEGSKRPTATLSTKMRAAWKLKLARVSMASDGVIPNENVVIRGYQSGVKYIAAPGAGGTENDLKILEICNQLNMTVARLTFRILHH